MPTITLPDGSQRQYTQAITIAEIAADIGAGLAKAALAGKVDERLVDTSYIITNDAAVSIITDKSPEGIEVIRHSAAHLLAMAVKELFPSAQITIGPVIEEGFYYDIAYERGFSEQDLQTIETRMTELAAKDFPVRRFEMSRNEAIEFFKKLGENYKVQIIQDLPETENLSFYQQGDFIDLCRGPHVPSTGKIKAFKLTKVAGAYWRGDSRNEMLQRIYGTAWLDKKALDAYLHRIEEAEKRDHRKLAKALDLFHLQEEAPGMVFWHPKGWQIWQVMQHYITQKIRHHGYQEIRTPQIADRSLWEKSGHMSKYGDEMFLTESENHTFAIKPMSCPLHVQVFKQGLKSYRDLPLRFAEFGCCHRNELSGALHGLMRVRSLVQDDGHIFCTEDQIQEEVSRFIDVVFEVYHDFGFDEIMLHLSTRPEKRVGDDTTWDKAEKALETALTNKGKPWKLYPGDGAFYGPKIDFHLRDCIGRVWQCGTMQLDFMMPERLGAYYIAEDGSKKTPVILHRAILGSFERFIGIVLENFAGKLPPWLAPIQAVVCNITDNQAEYASHLVEILKKRGVRVDLDLRNEKIGFKIREHTLQRVPYLIIIGDREKETNTLAVRTQEGKDLGSLNVDEFCLILDQAVARYGRFALEE